MGEKPPKTNTLPLKNGGLETTFLLGSFLFGDEKVPAVCMSDLSLFLQMQMAIGEGFFSHPNNNHKSWTPAIQFNGGGSVARVLRVGLVM